MLVGKLGKKILWMVSTKSSPLALPIEELTPLQNIRSHLSRVTILDICVPAIWGVEIKAFFVLSSFAVKV